MISVCMATYNGEKYIKEQIDSILKQLDSDDELIISDDHSTDHTLEIINQFHDNRIKIYINNNNKGYTSNFYNALGYACGDYIFLSDQDDIWATNKVKKTLDYLSKYDFVVSDCYESNADLEIICESRFEKYNIKSGFIFSLLKCRYLGCCMAFSKNVLRVLLPPPSYKNSFPHDLWVTLIGELYFKHCTIPDKLIIYRRHSNNASNGGDDQKNKRNIFIRLFSRIYYLASVIFILPRIIRSK